MVRIPGRRSARDPGPVTITSRLLPSLLDEEKLAARGPVNILDLGRANSSSLEFFNRFPCRLTVLDAAESLIEWSRRLEQRMEDPPSQQQMQHELAGLLRTPQGTLPFDIVFLWDTFNHLHEYALPAFAALLRKELAPGFKGHGFMLHKRGTEQQLRHMGLAGPDLVRINESHDTPLYAHNRRVVNDALGPAMQVDHGVLHGDGRLEFLLTQGRA